MVTRSFSLVSAITLGPAYVGFEFDLMVLFARELTDKMHLVHMVEYSGNCYAYVQNASAWSKAGKCAKNNL